MRHPLPPQAPRQHRTENSLPLYEHAPIWLWFLRTSVYRVFIIWKRDTDDTAAEELHSGSGPVSRACRYGIHGHVRMTSSIHRAPIAFCRLLATPVSFWIRHLHASTTHQSGYERTMLPPGLCPVFPPCLTQSQTGGPAAVLPPPPPPPPNTPHGTFEAGKWSTTEGDRRYQR